MVEMKFEVAASFTVSPKQFQAEFKHLWDIAKDRVSSRHQDFGPAEDEAKPSAIATLPKICRPRLKTPFQHHDA